MFKLKLEIITPTLVPYQPHSGRRYFCQTLYYILNVMCCWRNVNEHYATVLWQTFFVPYKHSSLLGIQDIQVNMNQFFQPKKFTNESKQILWHSLSRAHIQSTKRHRKGLTTAWGIRGHTDGNVLGESNTFQLSTKTAGLYI